MNFFFKLKKIISEKRLLKTLKKKIYPYFIGFLLFFKPNDKTIKIYVSKANKVDKKDLPLAERIFKSYKHSKIYQEKKSDLYKPASLWQSHINNDFSFLLESHKNNDVEKFLFFLQNFGNWDNYLGVESQNMVKKYSKNPLLKKFLSEEIFGGQLKLWRFFNKDLSLSEIKMPRHGNQIGATINDEFVVIGSFSNDIYAKNLKSYFKEQDSKILEIGGGYGKFAYYLLKNVKNFTYINFDIPETLTLASYYLSKSFPSKKNFFYGEQTFTKQIENNYDLIFLPPWEIETLENNTFDLAINKNSLGEMQPETAKNFIKQIHRISKYFFSMNHEYFRNHFSDGKKSLINREYNIDGKFRELIRYPDIGHLTYENNKIDFDSNTFFYIYEKK